MAKNQSTSKVTRITASDDKAPVKSAAKSTTSASAASKSTKVKAAKDKTPKTKRSWGLLGKIGGYFKGAWAELRLVHWPTRQATWGLTGAVLLFSLFFVVFIALLDAGFKFLFEQILK